MLHGCMAAWLHGCMAAWLHGCMAAGTTAVGIGPALVAALWAFDGWNDIVFMAEEIKNPATAIPFSISVAIAIVAVIYIMLNLAFAFVLPTTSIIKSTVVAAALAEEVAGTAVGTAVSLLVAVSVLGTTFGSIMTGARYLFAAARNGHAPASLANLSPRFGSPVMALAVQACAPIN